MAKDRSTTEAALKSAPTHTGKIRGIRATANDLIFDIEGKKGKLHTLSLDLKATHLIALILACHTAGKKVHITLSATGAVSELRIGGIRKVKQKTEKKVKPVTVSKTVVEQLTPPTPATGK